MRPNTEQTTEPEKILIPYARVSSGPQADEDKTGLDRQLESARRTLAAHPKWKLDETFNLVDAGFSGYKGKNLEPEAALGGFLEAVKTGKVPLTPTKVLHIDEMSRLSRLPIRKARTLFEGIIDSGVEIYIAQDNKLYTKQSLDDPMDLIISLLRQEAATNYAKNLGNSISKSYTIRRRRLVETGKPYRFKAPGWLKWIETSKMEGYYELIPERVKSIERVFELANMGLGVRGITRQLNAEKAPLICNPYNGKKKKSRHWANVSVQTLLTKKTVLGFDESVNPPVKMYPAAIDEKVYYAAKAKMDARKRHKYYGRSSEKVENLFVGLVHCSVCNRGMSLHKMKSGWILKNPDAVGSRGGKPINTYLQCSGFVDGICSSKQIRYDWVEESFCSMLSGSQFVNAYSDTKNIAPNNNTEVLKGKLAEINASILQYTADYKETKTRAALTLIAEAEQESERLTQEIESATAIEVGSIGIDEAKAELVNTLHKDFTNRDTRLQLRELIRAVVERIVVNIKEKSYVVHWKGKAKPNHVECFRKGFRIDGVLYESVGDWDKVLAETTKRAKEVEPDPEKEKRLLAKIEAEK